MTSADLNWLIIRDNNAFLLKKRNVKKPFSTVSQKCDIHQQFTNNFSDDWKSDDLPVIYISY